jgi:hypothetical protein
MFTRRLGLVRESGAGVTPRQVVVVLFAPLRA